MFSMYTSIYKNWNFDKEPIMIETKNTTSIKLDDRNSAQVSNTGASFSAGDTLTISASSDTTITEGPVTIDGSISASLVVDQSVSASAGINDNNLQVSVGINNIITASSTASLSASIEYANEGVSGTVTATSGESANLDVSVGQNGAAVDAGASIGSSVGVSGEVTAGVSGVQGTAGAGVSVGEELSAGGSAQATYTDGVIDVGMAGDIAVLLGVDVDVNISIDTNKVTDTANQGITAVESVAPVVNNTVNIASQETKKVTNKINKGFKKAFHL